jgi:tetraacyldisaccharide 4'-kinase
MISAVYAAIARRRREWYAARPDARRRLRHPVISIGNIAAGGRGKTPFTAAVARMLLELGERPAILSRGYARTRPEDGAVVVRDAYGIRADVARAGDEPFMLARQLPGAIVISSPDRYLGGRIAEHHLGATVHLLDDGFQHFQLDRDVDVVLVRAADLAGASTFPGGRLREPADVLVAADAIVALDHLSLPDARLTHVDVPIFSATRVVHEAVFDAPVSLPSRDVLAVAGIAEPQPFLDSIQAAGWTVVASKLFADHHAYSSRDVAALIGAARGAAAAAVLTTEKDYVRLLPFRPFALPVGQVPLTMEPEPRAEFRQWLVSSIASARDIALV